MKKSVLSILGGILFCLPMLLTSCNANDNALEQIVNQPTLEGLQKALYTNAEVTVQYTVYGKTDPYTVTLKNVGTVENPKYEVQGELPTDLGYTLKCDLGYENEMLYFGLAYGAIETGEEDESEDIFDMAPVMVVRFDTKTSKYDVFALPGFSFKVISINGTEMEVTDAGEGNTATINFYHQPAGGGSTLVSGARTRYGLPDPTPIEGMQMKLNLTNVTTWGDLDKTYDEVGLGVFGTLANSANEGAMVIDLSDYKKIYFADDDTYTHVFEIKNSDNQYLTPGIDISKENPYKAIDYSTEYYLPCYGLNSRGNIALLEVFKLKLTGLAAGYTWEDVAKIDENKVYLKLVYTSGKVKLTVVNQAGKPNGKYYGLYDGKSSLRVDATEPFKMDYNYHLYQLKDRIKDYDVDEYVYSSTITSR